MNKPSQAVPAVDPRWAWHYRTLTAARHRLQRQLIAHVHEAVAPGDPDGDQIDRASEELDHDVALALVGGAGRTLAEVDDALRRLERGTYGTCEATGQPIPTARLRALPWCRYLIDVEATREHHRLSTPSSHA